MSAFDDQPPRDATSPASDEPEPGVPLAAPRGGRALAVALCAIALGFIGAAVYAVFIHETPPAPISYRVTGLVIGDPDEIRVTFEVSKPADRRAVCQVAAFTEKGASAGRLVGIDVPPRSDGSPISTLTVTVRTEKPAVDAAVPVCQLR